MDGLPLAFLLKAGIRVHDFWNIHSLFLKFFEDGGPVHVM